MNFLKRLLARIALMFGAPSPNEDVYEPWVDAYLLDLAESASGEGPYDEYGRCFCAYCRED